MDKDQFVYKGDNPLLQQKNTLAEAMHVLHNEQSLQAQQRQVDLSIKEQIEKLNEQRSQIFDAVQVQTEKLNHLNICNDFSRFLTQAYMEHSTDPQGLQTRVDSFKDRLLESIPNVKHRAFMREQFNGDIANYYLKTVDGARRQTDKKLFDSSKRSIDLSATTVALAMQDACSDNEALSASGITQIGEAYENVKTLLNMTDSNNQPLFDQGQQDALMDAWKGAALESFCKEQMRKLPIDKQAEFVQKFSRGEDVFWVNV